MEVTQKTCPTCKRVLPASEFNANRTKRDGLDVYCRECRKVYRGKSGRGRTFKVSTPEGRDSELLDAMRRRHALEDWRPPYEW